MQELGATNPIFQQFNFRKFQNSNDLLVCPTDSPLAPFLLMRHLQVNFQEVSQTLTEGIVLKLQVFF